MIGRALRLGDWLGYVATYDFGRIAPTRVVLHHTEIPTAQQWRGLASMRGMQTFYRRKGWDAAPHLYVGPERGANIWLFNPMSRVGIHANAGNSGVWNGRWGYSIGLEMVGDYDQARPNGPIWDSSLAVLGGLSLRLGIAPRQLISFHRDYNKAKSCPGWAVTKEWVWAEVESWIRGRTLPDPTPALRGETYIVRGVAFVRDEPRLAAPKLQKLSAGTPVEIFGHFDDGDLFGGSRRWYVTTSADYIHSSALRKA